MIKRNCFLSHNNNIQLKRNPYYGSKNSLYLSFFIFLYLFVSFYIIMYHFYMLKKKDILLYLLVSVYIC